MKTPKQSRAQAQSSSPSSRRRFTKAVAAAFVAAPLVAASSGANSQTPPATKEATAPPNPQPSPTPAAAAPPKPSPLAESYAEVARVRFGEGLKPEELERVKRDLDGNVRTAERLRASKLKNADEPDFVFIP
ncbi:MAG TPA: hypothetical protein VNA19_11960 [Pyrinomonadaceae bacterium]|jgi:hypothetical protein|nr:hypothetical protein [Pyrinomonadaceae bacterium]